MPMARKLLILVVVQSPQQAMSMVMVWNQIIQAIAVDITC
jgi:hypothetical protein